MTTAIATATAVRPDHTDRGSRAVLIAVWAAPALVLGQFALIAGIPIAVVLVGALRNPRSRALRWWAGALGAAYAAPVALWLIGPSSAPSLSKYLSPTATAGLVATGVAVAIAHHVLRGRSGEKVV
ncbi:hypothetical protein [Actinokineospora sp. NBRC 105648]|uniref:hypothetical protein n=1 Tax=Actinokineospora sp. NBRC 105648 TaxID=3032206 RepID=UPI0024A34FE8|nr:hypothetical protein [Actinokineospora sp. NBRC 105648]GLZ37176.1 hypothetical protein Acsp05_08010 [Actinokineospora sp. NBRC 105648]